MEAAMRKLHILAVAFVPFALASAVHAAWYFTSQPSGDQLSENLRSLGYLPVNPPSNLLNLGSLYYLDSEVKFFKTICAANPEDLAGAVIKSPSTRTLADELDTGNYSVRIKLNGGTVGSGQGDMGDKYVRKIRYSLSEVQLYEIPLGANRKIFSKLMEKEDCSDAVADVIGAGGYVCQGQQIMEATVEYDLKFESENTAKVAAQVDSSAIVEALKVAAHSDTGTQLVEKSGRLVTGTALKYGIAMNPTCLTPLHARFARILPKTAFARFMNFVKFQVLEPILPRT
jgi:hypothetical protein